MTNRLELRALRIKRIERLRAAHEHLTRAASIILRQEGADEEAAEHLLVGALGCLMSATSLQVDVDLADERGQA